MEPRRYLIWGSCGVALLLALSGCAHVPAGPPPDYDGTLMGLEAAGELAPAELKGRVILVQFFATWCFPCLGAFPELIHVEKAYADRGLTVVAVGMDLEGALVLGPFAEREQPPFPVLIADDVIRSGQSAFGKIPEVPVSYLVGRDGKLLAAWPGLVGSKRLESGIEEALSK
jgi:thiol-disulfide isomerase/thioredoxin